MFHLTNSTIIACGILAALLAGLMVVVSLEPIRRHLAKSAFSYGAISVVAAALGAVATYTLDLTKTAIDEEAIPGASLNTFIEDVRFGLPTFSDEYQKRVLTSDEVTKLLRPFKLSKDEVIFTSDEADRLDNIASGSGMVEPVYAERSYSISTIAGDLLTDPIYYYARYKRWAAVTSTNWAIPGDTYVKDRHEVIRNFIDKRLSNTLDSAGIFQAIIGMADRGMLAIPDVAEVKSCGTKSGDLVSFEHQGKTYVANFITFTDVLATDDDDDDRKQLAEKLVNLIGDECVETIAEIFQQASQNFNTEDGYMKTYLDEMKAILAYRRSNIIYVIATISNIGKYDAFVRKDAKVVVGPKGGSNDDLSFIVELNNESLGDSGGNSHEQKLEGPYIGVPSRSAITGEWSATLSDDTKDRIYGSYTSGLTFLRLGMIANSGNGEVDVLSPLTPFSKAAKQNVMDHVINLAVPL